MNKKQIENSAKTKVLYDDIVEHIRDNLSKADPKVIKELIRLISHYRAEQLNQSGILVNEHDLLERSYDRYFELYDLAPIGYLTMNKDWVIEETNLTCTDMLGIEKSRLEGTRFIHYVVPDSHDVFYSYCQKRIDEKQKMTCELKLHGSSGNEFWAVMESTVEKNDIGEITAIRVTITDITESKDKTKVEAVLGNIMQSSQDAITMQDFDGNILSWNKGAEEMYGYSRAEALKMKITKLVPEDKRVELANLRSMLRGKADIRTLETKRLTINGDIIHVWMTISVFGTPSGVPEGFLAIERDITESKKAEQERARLVNQLSEQQILLETIINQMPVGLMIAVPPDGKIIQENKMVNEIFGYEAKLAKSIADYGRQRRVYHMDGRRYEKDEFPLTRIIKNRETISNEKLEIERHDGERRIISVDGAPVINEIGDMVAGILSIQNITKELEHENQLREAREFAENIIASMRDGLLVLDKEMKVVRANLPYSQLFEVPVSDIVEKHIYDIQDGIWDNPLIRKNLGQLVEEGEEFDDLELEQGLPGIGKRVIVINGRIIINRDGKPNMLLLSFRDISEYRTAKHQIERLNRTLMQKNAALEETNRELEAFTYSVSHDLRAPLRTMDGFSRILLDDYGDKIDKKGVHYLSRIIAGAENMNNLIEDLLRLSNVAQAIVDDKDVNLSEMALSIAGNLKKLEPERDVTFKIEDKLIVRGDPKLLEQALENMLQNAWKYSSKTEHAKIEFGSKRVDGRMTYYVSDNGAGFDFQYADKLFEPFQRLHTSTDYGGTGIGLSIVDRIIRRHDGRVWASSTEDKGATFYFTLHEKE